MLRRKIVPSQQFNKNKKHGNYGKNHRRTAGSRRYQQKRKRVEKQEYVLETHDQYPKKVCFQIFGADRIDQAAIQPGEELTVFFDIDSREYQGRWFTNINAWKVERPMAAAPQSAPGAMTPET